MDKAHLSSMAEQVLVIAGSAMEDLSPDMLVGGRDAGRLSSDAERLLSLAEDAAVLAGAAISLIRLADETASGPA